MKFNSKLIPLLIFSSIGIGILIGGYLNYPSQLTTTAKNSQKNKLNKLLAFIDREYVDDINTDSIVDLALSDILEKLDPHSVYIPAEEQSLIAQSMKGDFVGVGINYYMYNDSLTVINTIDGGASQRAGIKAGDRILYAGKSKIFGRKLPRDSIFRLLKGTENSNIQLTIFRKSTRELFKLNLKRAKVTIKSIDIGTLIAPNTGYIKINKFAESTHQEFLAALQILKKEGMRTLILDVRNNGGGYMEQAIAIADELLSKSQLIVFTKNKKGNIERSFATAGGAFEKGNIFILINENSASASEILAGAIQDNDRGTIVGRRSFGKGLVQREMNFDDGSAVRLTIARYFTPTGRSIQKPYQNGTEAYYKAFDKRFASGELFSRDSIKVNDSLKFKTPKGKLLYGGGGIVPDIFIPLKTNTDSNIEQYIIESDIVGNFVFEELDKDRAKFQNIPIQKLQNKIIKSAQIMTQFEKYIQKTGIELSTDLKSTQIKDAIYAEFIKQLHGNKAYFDHILKSDNMIQAILK